MILYFSGTGNSRRIANNLAKHLADDVIDASVYTKTHSYAEFVSTKPYVFVAPTYASYIPMVFEKFIRESKFGGSDIFYFVLTCGISIDGAGYRLEELCNTKSKIYMGTAKIIMPENYISVFMAPPKFVSDFIIAKADKKSKIISKIITSRQKLKNGHGTKLTTYHTNKLFYKYMATDKLFKVSQKCIKCKLCLSVCPLSNIHIKDGIPTWKGNCTACQACINICPAKAINFGIFTRFKKRYYLDR